MFCYCIKTDLFRSIHSFAADHGISQQACSVLAGLRAHILLPASRFGCAHAVSVDEKGRIEKDELSSSITLDYLEGTFQVRDVVITHRCQACSAA